MFVFFICFFFFGLLLSRNVCLQHLCSASVPLISLNKEDVIKSVDAAISRVPSGTPMQPLNIVFPIVHLSLHNLLRD